MEPRTTTAPPHRWAEKNGKKEKILVEYRKHIGGGNGKRMDIKWNQIETEAQKLPATMPT